ncbi:hypothetical protein NDU88_004272 [Pleurodeles waltl]|uniref:Uncharacterized protein n=1 Tax=Pleurodeles waltl TaxID=8319 RepID=A0AAV7L0J3_PLEWA|nr:hypothetical protein NDU88_004272 [Pleurodeles waltl]
MRTVPRCLFLYPDVIIAKWRLEEMPFTDESGVQASESVQTPPEQRFPAFTTPGADPSVFLNAMVSILNRDMDPTCAPAGPTGLLAFTLGLTAPHKQAPFVPFYPGEGAGSASMTSPPWMMLLTAPMESMPAPNGSRSTNSVSPSCPPPERPSALKLASATSANPGQGEGP